MSQYKHLLLCLPFKYIIIFLSYILILEMFSPKSNILQHFFPYSLLYFIYYKIQLIGLEFQTISYLFQFAHTNLILFPPASENPNLFSKASLRDLIFKVFLTSSCGGMYFYSGLHSQCIYVFYSFTVYMSFTPDKELLNAWIHFIHLYIMSDQHFGGPKQSLEKRYFSMTGLVKA